MRAGKVVPDAFSRAVWLSRALLGMEGTIGQTGVESDA
jgi:hypothetical protein